MGASDGGVVHEVLHHLEHRVGEYADAASDGAPALAERLEAEAEEYREEDERQHRVARKQLDEVVGRDGLDYLVGRAERLNFARRLHFNVDALRRREERDQQRRYRARDREDEDERLHNLAEALHRRHRGDGAANRREDERDDDHEHRVDEEVAERLEDEGPLAHHGADYAAERDGSEQDDREAVRLEYAVRF